MGDLQVNNQEAVRWKYSIQSSGRSLATFLGDVEIDGGLNIIQYAVTPQEFGALGNGSHDDTSAIQQAVNTGFPVVFPLGLTYLITSPITATAPVILLGTGATILGDCSTFQLYGAAVSNSVIIGFNFQPVTTPTTINNNPQTWTQTLGMVTASFNGYMPTSQDAIWASLSAPVQNQQNVRAYQRPGIWVKVTNANPITNIYIANIRGLASSIVLEGCQYSKVENCTLTGNTGEATILLNNGINYDTTGTLLAYTIPRGIGNKILNNDLSFASYCGIALGGNDAFTISGNSCYNNGESAIKTLPHDGSAQYTTAVACTSGVVSGNTSFWQYYDGLDIGSVYGVPGYLPAMTCVTGNTSYQNRATGITVEGTLNMSVVGNMCWENGTDGINYTGSWGAVSGNMCRANCKFGPTGVNNQWGTQQMWDLFIAGDAVASSGNSVVCSYVPYTYAYVHEGSVANAGVPTPSLEGTDSANSVAGLTSAMYIYATIPTDRRLQSTTNVTATNGKVDSGASVVIATAGTYVTVVSNTTGMILLRDAAGGVALYTFDPIGGAPVAITPSTIAGLLVQSSGGNFQITVASGAPRTIGFLALLTQ